MIYSFLLLHDHATIDTNAHRIAGMICHHAPDNTHTINRADIAEKVMAIVLSNIFIFISFYF